MSRESSDSRRYLLFQPRKGDKLKRPDVAMGYVFPYGSSRGIYQVNECEPLSSPRAALVDGGAPRPSARHSR